MVLKKLKPGMTVYDVRPSKGLHKMFSSWDTWTVVIKEVDYENNRVLASWSGNEPEWFSEYFWKKWRLKSPNN